MLLEFQPQQRYLLIDRSRSDGANGNLVNALFDLVDARTDAAIGNVLMRVAERLREPDMAAVRDGVTRWIQLTLQRAFRKTKIPLGAGLEGVQTMMRYIHFERYEDLLDFEAEQRGLERGLEKGLQKGLQKGREQGLEQGREQGALDANKELLRLLISRELGRLPDLAAEKINALDLETAKNWIARLLNGEPPDLLLGFQGRPSGPD